MYNNQHYKMLSLSCLFVSGKTESTFNAPQLSFLFFCHKTCKKCVFLVHKSCSWRATVLRCLDPTPNETNEPAIQGLTWYTKNVQVC